MKAEAFDIALQEFAAGGTPDLSGLHPGLHSIFAPQTARYMRDLIAANPEKVEQAKAKPNLAGWFVGQVMKATGGKANPKAVNEIVAAKLGL